jgi:hypothetical protein
VQHPLAAPASMYTQYTIAIVCILSLRVVPIFQPWSFYCCLLRSVSYRTTFTLTCVLYTNAWDTRYMCASCATLDPRKNQHVRRAIQRKQAQKASSGNRRLLTRPTALPTSRPRRARSAWLVQHLHHHCALTQLDLTVEPRRESLMRQPPQTPSAPVSTVE